MHPAAIPVSDLLKQITETRTRRSGPGGQHRNKVETAVVLVHTPTGMAAEASERRSQAENRKTALKRLRLKLAIEHRQPASGQPSALWQSRVRSRQLTINPAHEDFPALVAEAFDQLHATGWQIGPAAERLAVSRTQLVGLFRKAPAAWAALNTHRTAAVLPVLK
jgi:hypothetical protein